MRAADKREVLRLPLACLLLLLVLAPAAAAQSVPATPVVPEVQPVAPVVAEPAEGVVLQRGQLPWFSVTAPGATSLQIRIGSNRDAVDAGGLLDADAGGTSLEAPADGTAFGWRLPATSLLAIRPGTYWWQPVARFPAGEVVAGARRAIHVRFPASWTRKARIPRRYGRQGRGSFLVSRAGIPAPVSSSRWWSVAAVSANRWGLRTAGWTTLRPGRLDRRNVIGFGPLPSYVLGVNRRTKQGTWQRRMRCVRGGGCVEVSRRLVRVTVVDNDITINQAVPWEDGPEYPWMDEADLESTVLHELGHAAGNEGHVTGCAASPLNEYGELGQWWRAPRDRFRLRCTRVTEGSATARAASVLRPRYRYVEQDVRLPDVVETVRADR